MTNADRAARRAGAGRPMSGLGRGRRILDAGELHQEIDHFFSHQLVRDVIEAPVLVHFLVKLFGRQFMLGGQFRHAADEVRFLQTHAFLLGDGVEDEERLDALLGGGFGRGVNLFGVRFDCFLGGAPLRVLVNNVVNNTCLLYTSRCV